KGKIPPRVCAAGDLDVDKAVFEAVGRDQFALDFHDALQRFRQGKRYFADRALQPRQVRCIVDQLAIENGRYFVDAIGKQETTVENRDLGLAERHIRAIDIGNLAQIHSPLGQRSDVCEAYTKIGVSDPSPLRGG